MGNKVLFKQLVLIFHLYIPKIFGCIYLICVPLGLTIAQDCQPKVILVTSMQVNELPDSTAADHLGWDTTSWALYKNSGKVLAMDVFLPCARYLIPGETLPDKVQETFVKINGYKFRNAQQIVKVDDGYLIGLNGG